MKFNHSLTLGFLCIIPCLDKWSDAMQAINQRLIY